LAGYQDRAKLHLASGDDIFQAQGIHRDGIAGCYIPEAVVMTAPPKSLGDLMQQRIRWASKYPGYSSALLRTLPAAIFGFNLLFILLFIFAVTHVLMSVYALIFLSKWLLEYSFQRRWFRKYGERFSLLESFALSGLFPFYYVGVGLASLLMKNFKWKGRTYTN
jgi:hypothetical protein